MGEPHRTDVLIVGGGLAGCATAYYLAREGVAVSLIERWDLNTQQSGCNSGSLHAQIPHAPFVEYGDAWTEAYAQTIPLLSESIKLWSGLSEELDTDLEVSIRGGLLVAENDTQMRDIERKASVERSHGLAVEMLSHEALRDLAPYVNERLVGGAFCPNEGKANPLLAAPAFARAAQARGAQIRCRTELRSLERTSSGFRADTSGGVFEAPRVVNCAGTFAPEVARMVGLDVPIDGYPIMASITEPVAPLVKHLVYSASEKLSLKQAASGGVMIGGGWPSLQDPNTGRLSVDPASLKANLQVAQAVVPALADLRLLRTWSAVVTGCDDWKPVLGKVPGIPGFFMNAVPWLGFTAGPMAARAVAQLLLDRDPGVDMTAFSAGRYQ
jgi:glycine/D-amino acid oxidase-like deaminating enzyme